MTYAAGGASGDPDVVLYDVCRTFHKLPSEVEAEDPAAIERLAYIHYVVTSQQMAKMKAEAERARREINAGN